MKEAVTLIGLMSGMLTELQQKREDAEWDAKDTREKVYDMEEKLRSSKQANAQLRDRVLELESSNRTLTYEVTQLRNRLEPNKRPDVLPTDSERAKAYMEGDVAKNLLLAGNKIAVIKGIREVTGWGLLESKNYMEECIGVSDATKHEATFCKDMSVLNG